MTSTHQHHSRYPIPAPTTSLQSDFRLPSLKDLNFTYRPLTNGGSQPPPPQADLPSQQQEHVRHPPAWGRSNQPSNSSAAPTQSHPHQQQHTPPLSAGHEATPKAEYPTKHENGGYAHPGIPLSAQVTSIPGSVNIGNLRSEEVPHSPSQSTQVKRRQHPDSIANRDAHYPPQSYQYSGPPIAGYTGPPAHTSQPLPPPPPPAPHEQIHHHPIPPGYPTYQQQPYMQPRPPVMHQQHPSHSQTNHSNPYPSPGPPPSAPPPQGPWNQQPQHAPLPTHQQPPPPPPQQQPQHHVPQHQPHIQSHQQQQQQQPPPSIPTNPPTYAVPPHHMQPAPPPPPPQQQMPPQHVPHTQPQHQQQQQPPQQQHQQHQQQQEQQQQQRQPQQPQHQYQPQQMQQAPFGRTTAIVPTSVDTRAVYPPPPAEPERAPIPRPSDVMTDISSHCSVLYNFAFRWADVQRHVAHPLPPPQPSQAELEDMLQLAQDLVRLLEETKRANAPEMEQQQQQQQQNRVSASEAMQQSPDDPRPPKRPWEDVSQDDVVVSAEQSFSSEVNQAPPPQPQPPSYASGGGDSKPQTTAEQDMELIRTKRATTTAGVTGPPGQPKSKYRKRSRATPPGKCHSCNIRETPEWRRGPDGARTLCNACGLHYAKLMRKRDKNGANGESPHIDMETLRASARAAEIADKPSRSAKQKAQQQQLSEPASPIEVKHQPQTQAAQQHHQSTFQLVNTMGLGPGAGPTSEQSGASTDGGRGGGGGGVPTGPPPPTTAAQAQQPHSGMAPPSWATTTSNAPRVYAAAPGHPQQQHQSFMRGSQHSAPSR